MKLKKTLGTFNIFCMASGAMISSGIFVLPVVVYKIAGNGIFVAYLFAGIIMLPALFSKIELATAIPKAGGSYFFIDRILGSGAGVIAGFANWFSICLKSAFALYGTGIFITLFFPEMSELELKLIASSVCVLFTLLNIFSLKSSNRIQSLLVVFLLGILFFYIILGYRVVDFSSLKPTSFFDWNAIMEATGIVFISYGGLTKIASVAEEIKDPKKSIVKGGLYAFVVVQILYLLIILVLLGVMPVDTLNHSRMPLSDAVKFFPPGGGVPAKVYFYAISAAAIMAFLTTANAGIFASSRAPLAMGRDGLVPGYFSILTKKKRIPIVSLILTSVFIIINILLFDIKNLAKVASLFMILLFIMVNISVIVIRFSKVSNYKPSFKSPFFPVIQIAGIIVYIVLVIEMGSGIILISGLFVVLCLLWYVFYSRHRVNRKSALIHMIKNIMNPELKSGKDDENELESELLDILFERDEIIEDRFDRIIKGAEVIDFSKTISREELFSRIANVMCSRWNISSEELEKKMNKRERLSSTLIYPGIALPHAIPHAVIEGENIFDIVLVRNKFGIRWNENNDIVYTAFCLIGTKDERNFHIRALMYIAQILQDKDFQKEWTEAKNSKELRSVILLTKRRRG